MRLIDADALFESLTFPSEQWKESFKQLLDDEPTVLSENKGEDLYREKEQAYMQGYEDASKKYRNIPEREKGEIDAKET